MAILASSVAARWVSATPPEVTPAPSATRLMFSAISALPRAASLTLRPISAVVAACSSTAEAIVFWMSLISLMTAEMPSIASTASPVSDWIVSMRPPMSSVAFAVA